ncbi:MAG: hypothetical protein WA728_04360, partial [Xanthobacteraceae bacterium]
IIQTERAKDSMSASWYTLLLPDPLGPATIQKIGRLTLWGGNVGCADNAFVVTPRLGDVLSEHVPETFFKDGAIRVQRSHGFPSARGRSNALLTYRARSWCGKSTGFQAFENDLGQANLPFST